MDSNTVKLADVRPDLSGLDAAHKLWKSSVVEGNGPQIKRLRNELLNSEHAQATFCNCVSEVKDPAFFKPHIQFIRAECYRKLLNSPTLEVDTQDAYVSSAITCYMLAIQADASGCIDNNDKLKDIRIEAIGRLFSLEGKAGLSRFLKAIPGIYKDTDTFYRHVYHMDQFLKEHAQKDDASANARYYWIKRSLATYNVMEYDETALDNALHALSFTIKVWSKINHKRKQKIANYFLFSGPKIASGLTYKFRGIRLGHNIRWPDILVDENHIFKADDTVDLGDNTLSMRTLRETLVICYSWSPYWDMSIQTLNSKQRELLGEVMVHFIKEQDTQFQVDLLPRVPSRTFAKLEALQIEAKNIQAKVAENTYSKTYQFHSVLPKLNEILNEGNYLLQTNSAEDWPQTAKDAYDWALKRVAARVLSDEDLPPERALTKQVRDSMYI